MLGPDLTLSRLGAALHCTVLPVWLGGTGCACTSAAALSSARERGYRRPRCAPRPARQFLVAVRADPAAIPPTPIAVVRVAVAVVSDATSEVSVTMTYVNVSVTTTCDVSATTSDECATSAETATAAAKSMTAATMTSTAMTSSGLCRGGSSDRHDCKRANSRQTINSDRCRCSQTTHTDLAAYSCLLCLHVAYPYWSRRTSL